MSAQVIGAVSQQQSQAKPSTKARRTVAPYTDIYETPENIVLVADMPGVGLEDINISLEDDTLVIEGTRHEVLRDGYKPVYAEYELSNYRRVFTVSTDIARDKITATAKDGVLTLTLPKAEPVKARKITVLAT